MIRVLSAFLLALVIGVPIAAAEEALPPPPPVTVAQPTPPPAIPTPRPDPKPSAQQQQPPRPSSPAPAPPASQRSFSAKPARAAVSTPRVRPPSAKKKSAQPKGKPAQPKKKKPAQRKQQVAPPPTRPPLVAPRQRRGLFEPTWVAQPSLVAEPRAGGGTGPALTAYAVPIGLVGLVLAVAVPLARRRRQRMAALALPPTAITSENGNGVAGAAVISVAGAAASVLASAPPRAEGVAIAVEPRAEPALDGDETVPAADTAWERCEVRWWRGYVSSRFWAQSVENGQVTLSESPAFRWRRADPPTETEAAVAAHEALLDQLRSEGWVVDGRGDLWYDVALCRRRPLIVDIGATPAVVYEDV